MRSFSYGGGVQSTAALVLATQGRIDFQTFFFANVGDDSEHPQTLRYVEEVAKPFAADNGIELVELHKVRRDGERETLLGRLLKPGSRSLPIPVRMSNGAPGQRSCTADFKIRVIAKELKRRGATVADPAIVGIGISVDEIERARPGIDPKSPFQSRTYPLLDLGMHRSDCLRVIAEAGLPQPGKSACFFCPFHDQNAWVELRRHTPELFDQAAALEATLNERRDMLGKDHVWLTRHNKPLAEAVGEPAPQLPGLGACDSGYCFT